MDDDGEVVEMHIPSHGNGKLRPFVKGDPRTRELSRKGAEAARQKKLLDRDQIEAEKLMLTLQASARREVSAMLRKVGISDGDKIMAELGARPDIVAHLAKAMALSVLSRILADEFPIRSAGEAIKLVEMGVKIHRLEMGQATDIIESDDDRVDRIKAAVPAARRGA